jgi:hypothetical protein
MLLPFFASFLSLLSVEEVCVYALFCYKGMKVAWNYHCQHVVQIVRWSKVDRCDCGHPWQGNNSVPLQCPCAISGSQLLDHFLIIPAESSYYLITFSLSGNV